LPTGVSTFSCFFARINTRQPISSGRSKSSTPEIEVIYMIRKGQVKDDGVTQTAAAKFNSLVA
jgi:hypothetical protein